MEKNMKKQMETTIESGGILMDTTPIMENENAKA